MLSLALDTHAELDKTKDREWIHILLSFLKTYVDTVGLDLLMHEEDSVEYISRLVQAMRHSATTLESGSEFIYLRHLHRLTWNIRSSASRPSRLVYTRVIDRKASGRQRWFLP